MAPPDLRCRCGSRSLPLPCGESCARSAPPPPLAPGLPLPRLLELITRNLAAFRSAVYAPAAWAMTFTEPPGSDLHCEGRALYLAWEDLLWPYYNNNNGLLF